MSPHGGPDWGNRAKADIVFGVQDLGELAARLGSPATYHRGGKVIRIIDFEDNQWTWTSPPGYAWGAVAWFTGLSRNGSNSLRITTAAVADHGQGILGYLQYPQQSKLGVEWSSYVDYETCYLDHFSDLYDGTYRLRAGVRWNIATNKLYYLDASGAWVEMDPQAAVRYYATMFHTAKLIIDFPQERYKSLFLNEQSWNLTAQGLYKTADSSDKAWENTFAVVPTQAVAVKMYLDDIIFTQEEP